MCDSLSSLHARGADAHRPQRRPEFPVNAMAWAIDNREVEAVALLRSWGADTAVWGDDP